MTLIFDLGRWCGSTSSIRTPTLKFLGLSVRSIWHVLCVRVSRPVTLTSDLLTLKLVPNVARVIRYPPTNFGDTTTIRFRFMGHWANTVQTDYVTLWPWPLTLEVTVPVADAGRRPSFVTKFEVRKIWQRRTMCVSINGPGNPDLWPFNLETGTRVSSKVGNLPSKFGHAFWFWNYLLCMRRTDRQTDGRTDGQKQRLLPISQREGA